MAANWDRGDGERWCERVIMIDRGRLVFGGSLAVLGDRLGGDSIIVVDLESLPETVALADAELIRQLG